MSHKHKTNFYSAWLFSAMNLLSITCVWVLLIIASGSGTEESTLAHGGGGGDNSNVNGSLSRPGGLWAPNRTRNVVLEPDNSATSSEPPQTPVTVIITPKPAFVISNIRHHRSRKVFVRTTTTT